MKLMKNQNKKQLVFNQEMGENSQSSSQQVEDTIEKIGKSIIHHGKSSDRVYIMKFHEEDSDALYNLVNTLVHEKGYTKIIAKVSEKLKPYLLDKDFRIEAHVPKFYQGRSDGYFMSYYTDPKRHTSQELERINDVLEKAIRKKDETREPLVLDADTDMMKLEKRHTKEMAKVYQEVFDSYPFPIFDPEYLAKTMEENIIYYGVFHHKQLVAIASGETDYSNLNAEMTDFATLPQYRRQGYGQALLEAVESALKQEGYRTLYTIARAVSYGMNITFAKSNYAYGGRLINNTDIAGQIETMNIWYKNI